MTTPDLSADVPFVPLPGGIDTLDALMTFDKQTARVFREFRRPISAVERRDPIVATQHPDATIVHVKWFAEGVRMRLYLTPAVRRRPRS